jgi:ribose transport system substrate-binding protein
VSGEARLSHRDLARSRRVARFEVSHYTEEKVMGKSRVGALVATIGASAVLVACGGSDNSTSTASGGGGSKSSGSSIPVAAPGPFCGPECKQALKLNADPSTVKGKVGLSQNSLAFSYGVGIKNSAEAEAKKYFPNMDLTVTDGQGSVQKQSSDIDDLVARGIKVLLISPYQADALVPAIRRAEAAGVKVITYDRNANTDVTSFVSSDDVLNSEAVGNWLAKKMNGKARIIEITGTPGASPTVARHDGFHKAIAKYPGMKVIATANGDYLPTTGLKVVSDLLGRYKKGSFDAIYSYADDMSGGIARALREAGRAQEVPVVSINGQQVGVDLIKKGDMDATGAYALVGREAVMAAAKVLAGESLPKRITLDPALITKANASKYDGSIGW